LLAPKYSLDLILGVKKKVMATWQLKEWMRRELRNSANRVYQYCIDTLFFEAAKETFSLEKGIVALQVGKERLTEISYH
jgi:hypothetical protein